MRVSLLFLIACTGPTGKLDDSGGVTDSEADADTDADTDTDTDSTTCAGSVTGSVKAYDGSQPAGVEVQFCEITCFTAETDSQGAFEFLQMCEGSYKLDGVGEVYDGYDYGRIRAHVTLGVAENLVVEPLLFLPRMIGPVTVDSSGSVKTWSSVTIGLDLDTLTVPFGYEEDQISVGVVDGPDIPDFWDVTASYAIAFLPLATEVSAPFTLSATAELAPGNYDVLSVDAYGIIEGPVGSTVVGENGDIPNVTVAPSHLTWLLFVPA